MATTSPKRSIGLKIVMAQRRKKIEKNEVETDQSEIYYKDIMR